MLPPNNLFLLFLYSIIRLTNNNWGMPHFISSLPSDVSAEDARFLLRWKAELKLMFVLSGIIENYDYSIQKQHNICLIHSFCCSYLMCYSLNCEGSGVSESLAQPSSDLNAQRSLRYSGPALPQI